MDARTDSHDQLGKAQATKQIAVVGDEDSVIGFGLIGIKHLAIITEQSDTKEILDAIKEFIETPKIGFIIITQKIAERIRADFEKMKLEKPLYPIIIELPDKHGELAKREDPIRALIRRAIGMDVVKTNQ